MVEISLFLAIGIILTTLIKIPISVGFIHLGDFGLFLALCFFASKKHIHIALVFSIMFSDFILGFVIYAPITFFTRLIIILLSWNLKKNSLLHYFLWILIPLNYFLYDFVVFDRTVAIEFVIFNFLQITPIYFVILPSNIFNILKKKKKSFNLHSSKFEKFYKI